MQIICSSIYMSGVLWLTLDPEMHTHMCTIPHENTYISTVLVFEIFVPFFFFILTCYLNSWGQVLLSICKEQA